MSGDVERLFKQESEQIKGKLKELDFDDITSSKGRVFRHLMASLKYFSLNVCSKDKFMKDLLYNQEMDSFDRNLVSSKSLLNEQLCNVSVRDKSGFFSAVKKNEPVIFCAYHYGSYSFINTFLVSKGFDYIIPVTSDIYDKMKSDYEQNLIKLKANRKSSVGNIEILDAESSDLMIFCKRAIRSGRSILFYIDGNSGVGGIKNSGKNLIPVEFMGKTILSRSGISFLSYLLKVPIIPVISQRKESGSIEISFGDEVAPNIEIGLKEYLKVTTQYLYDFLSQFVVANPSLWEGWLYIYRFIPAQKNPPKSLFIKTADSRFFFNYDCYDFLIFGNAITIFDKENFRYRIVSGLDSNKLVSLCKSQCSRSDLLSLDINDDVISMISESLD